MWRSRSRCFWPKASGKVRAEPMAAKKVSPEGDTAKKVSPKGDTAKKISPEGDTAKESKQIEFATSRPNSLRLFTASCPAPSLR